MVDKKAGLLLRIFIGESEKKNGRPLYEWLVNEARHRGIAGATVFRGIMGFGAHSLVHTSKILDLASNLPVVVEVSDTSEKIQDFLAVVEESIKDGMATLQEIEMHIYSSK